jgi:hypothetical protein
VGDTTGARDVDPAARRDASGSPEPMLVRRKNRPRTKMGLAPSVTKTDNGTTMRTMVARARKIGGNVGQRQRSEWRAWPDEVNPR